MSNALLLDPRSYSTSQGVSVTATNHAAVAKGKLPALSDAAIKDVAKLFKLLADETRLRILTLLTKHDECHVRALCDVLGQSQPAVSHHLALLRKIFSTSSSTACPRPTAASGSKITC
ncbi:MAG: hypothetical protein DCC68_25580 [Planctomycetota bacterium]|nr:MAG: hypothetical protein DCC68_25580 [Planctomycetota bacterium]